MKLIDVHLYFGKWGFPIKPISTEGIVKLMDRMNIEKAVLMSALGIGYNFVEGNASLAKEIESWNQLFGYVYINGNYIEQSLKEMDYYLINDKFVGVKFQALLPMILNAMLYGKLWRRITESLYLFILGL